MRTNGVRKIAFSSTGSVYGEAAVFPTPEDAPFPVQTSLYGASKVAGEGLIAAYVHGFGMQAWVFRFVSILGECYTHGHVVDFYKKLRASPAAIEVLGNGKQRKSYMYVQDCMDAIQTAVSKANDPINIFNLGTNEYCTVDDSLGWICSHLGLSPQRNYTGGERGWIGDNPFIFLDTKKICSLGWQPKLTIREAVLRTLQYLEANPWVLEHRRLVA
jgi:UDP-glucose 4-epimerase